MASRLKDYFPIIREREEILAEIRKKPVFKRQFESWEEQYQEKFLDMCTGVKGLKLLYDGFFKEIMSPEYAPKRLDSFLSCLLGQKVTVVRVIPTDSARIAGESALLAMDIVVELSDGSIADVEMQRIGYRFPGQRSACYSADLLLRQYKRVRGDKEEFDYRDVKNVYTIVLFEKSPKIFHEYPECCYHFFEQKSDTGIEIELLQKYLFIPLDIFTKKRQNKDRKSERDAWLTLFACDEPEVIAGLLEEYPEFKDIYEEGYQICLNMKKVMGMFSKELYMLDRNTERHMFEDMRRESEEMKKKTEEMKKETEKLRTENEEMQKKAKELRTENEKMQKKAKELRTENEEMQRKTKELQSERKSLQYSLDEMEDKYNQVLKNTVNILRSAGLPDEEIIYKLCKQYQLEKKKIQQYL